MGHYNSIVRPKNAISFSASTFPSSRVTKYNSLMTVLFLCLDLNQKKVQIMKCCFNITEPVCKTESFWDQKVRANRPTIRFECLEPPEFHQTIAVKLKGRN